MLSLIPPSTETYRRERPPRSTRLHRAHLVDGDPGTADNGPARFHGQTRHRDPGQFTLRRRSTATAGHVLHPRGRRRGVGDAHSTAEVQFLDAVPVGHQVGDQTCHAVRSPPRNLRRRRSGEPMWLCRPTVRFRCGSSATAFAAEAATPPASARPNFWSSWAVAMNSGVCLLTVTRTSTFGRTPVCSASRDSRPILVEGIGHDAAHTGLKRAPQLRSLLLLPWKSRRSPDTPARRAALQLPMVHIDAQPLLVGPAGDTAGEEGLPRRVDVGPGIGLCVGSAALPEVPLVQQEQRRSVFGHRLRPGPRRARGRRPRGRPWLATRTRTRHSGRRAVLPIGARMCEVLVPGPSRVSWHAGQRIRALTAATTSVREPAPRTDPGRWPPPALAAHSHSRAMCSGASSSSLRGRTRTSRRTCGGRWPLPPSTVRPDAVRAVRRPVAMIRGTLASTPSKADSRSCSSRPGRIPRYASRCPGPRRCAEPRRSGRGRTGRSTRVVVGALHQQVEIHRQRRIGRIPDQGV